MKKLSGLTIVVLLCITGCGEKSKNSSLKNLLTIFGINNAGSQISMSSVLVLDANGVELGKALSITTASITLYTSTGHIVTINWAGNPGYELTTSYILFSNTGCTGTAYAGGTFGSYGKMTASDGTNWYIPKTVNSDGSAYSASVTYQSGKNYGSLCSASGSTQVLVELVQVAKTNIGLPATIATPISLTFR